MPGKRGRRLGGVDKDQPQDSKDQAATNGEVKPRRSRRAAAPPMAQDSRDTMPSRRGAARAAKLKIKEEIDIKEEEEDEEEPTVPPAKKKAKIVKKKVQVKAEVDDATPSTSTSKNTGGGKGSKSKKSQEDKENTNGHSTASVKSGVERVVMMKGRAPVDGLCSVAKQCHVYVDEDDDIWDCMLNQTNIQFNNNKYYLIQLLESDAGKTYWVWMRWGRVGANGQNALHSCGSDLNKAMKIFTKKFSDKTKNEWEERDCFEKVPGKYDLLAMDYSSRDEPDTSAMPLPPKPKVESKLNIRVKALVELVCDVKAMEADVIEMKYDANKAPLGKLTTEQIRAGYLALRAIEDLVTSEKHKNKDLVQACNDFYTRIPHYFGMKVPPLIQSRADIQEKMALLQALGDIQAALSVLHQPSTSDLHPTDQHYVDLKCSISPLESDSIDYKVLEQYLQTTHGRTHTQYKLELLEAFTVTKELEQSRFRDVGNRMLLWHGSRMSNWAGILSQGLRVAPPEAPCTGYMFGKGIYFADMASKSANYCWATQRNDVGFLLLSEVSLGRSNTLYNADYNANKLPSGCHSVKGSGRTAPCPENQKQLADGTVVPLGPCREDTGKAAQKYSLLYNEYIVYDPAQVRTRFLLKVRFNFRTMF